MLNRQQTEPRQRVGRLLAGGLTTQADPFPENNHQAAATLSELRELDPDDLTGKLVLSGVINHPHGADRKRCMDCVHYVVHRKCCGLPELALPSAPDWWCRFWRT